MARAKKPTAEKLTEDAIDAYVRKEAERRGLRSGLRARLGKPEPAGVDASRYERQAQKIVEGVQDRMSVDAEAPSVRRKRIARIPEPAQRTVKTWRGRKPIIKGGAVTGRRTGGNTA